MVESRTTAVEGDQFSGFQRCQGQKVVSNLSILLSERTYRASLEELIQVSESATNIVKDEQGQPIGPHRLISQAPNRTKSVPLGVW